MEGSRSEVLAWLFYRLLGPKRMVDRFTDRHTEDCISLVRSFCSATDRILDLGCGAGRICVPLARAGMNITGVDLLPQMIQAAREYLRGSGSTMDLVVASMLNLPFASESFTRLFCLRTFGHMLAREEQLMALREALRVLCIGGIALFEVNDGESKRIREYVGAHGFGPDGRVVRLPVEELTNEGYIHDKRTLASLGIECGAASYEVKFRNLGGRRRIILWLTK